MKIDYTLHTHTVGFDGRNTVEDMVCVAQVRGFKVIGFSNHFIVHPDISKSPMYKYALRAGYANMYSNDAEYSIHRFGEHFAAVRALREKYPNMKILCGMEMDWFQYPEWGQTMGNVVARLRPDYVIGAMHFIDRGMDGVLNVHDIKNASPVESRRLLREYYQNLIKLAEYDWRPMGFRFNWIAHFDLPRKVGLAWPDMEDAGLKALALNGMPIEINTALMGNKNYAQIGGRAEKIRQIVNAGVPVLVGDDAHDIERIGTGFSVVEKLADSKNLCANFNILKQKIGVRSY